MAKSEKSKKILSVGELEAAALPLAPKMARDYWLSGANEMQTVRDNRSAFDNYRIRARALRDVSKINFTPKPLFGKTYKIPVGIAPTGFQRLAHDEGELATARAANAKNWPMGLSSYSNTPLDQVKQAGQDSVVFLQLYVFKNRETTEKLVRWAEKVGYKALLLTVDTPVIGRRFADVHNEFKLPPHLSLGNFPDSSGSGPVDIGVEPESQSRKGFADDDTRDSQAGKANVLDPSLTWEETIPWLRSITKMEVWVKGIVTSEDAQLALDAGVDGVWVSNHGGRQLDSALATLDSLPEVVETINGRIPVHVDGGVRSGSDVFKALALGADFVWLGRPVLFGLQYDGQLGVELLIDIIEEDLGYVMALSGNTDISKVGKKSLVRIGPAIQKL